MLVFSFDIGLDRAMKRFKDKDVEVKTYPIPLLDTVRPKPYALKFWNSFYSDYKEASESGKYATIVIDTGTAVYELARHAYAEELGTKNLLPFQYGDVYARLSSIIMSPRTTGHNLVITHHLKDRYVNDVATGELEIDGYKRTEGLVDVVLLTNVRQVKGKTPAVVTTIDKCGLDITLNGTEIENLDYEQLVAVLGLES